MNACDAQVAPRREQEKEVKSPGSRRGCLANVPSPTPPLLGSGGPLKGLCARMAAVASRCRAFLTTSSEARRAFRAVSVQSAHLESLLGA